MEEQRSSFVAAGVALGIIVPAIYLGGYFALGTFYEEGSIVGIPHRVRLYDHRLIARVYKPLAEIESQATGKRVGVYGGKK
jgi:hypothetical protein